MNNKKISTKFAAAAAVALWMTACSENIETRSDDSTQNISIGVSVHQGWNDATPKKSAPQATRAAQSGEQQAVTKADGTIGQQDVFLWCDELNGISGKGLEVEVSASTQGDEATRGKLMTGTLGNDAANEKFHKTFSIYGEKAPGGRTATWRHDNEWSLSSSFTWGDFDTDNYDFYAIAPADAAVSNASETGFTYTVPQNATNQHDLMVGLATAKRSDRHMWFDFNHALSAVKFKIGNDGFKSGFSFKKIEILGVARTNTYTFAKDSEGKEAGTWGTPTGTIDVTSQMVGSGVGSLGGANTMITSDTDGTTFVLLPQTLSTDIQVRITLEDSNGEISLTANLNLTGITEWLPGHTYVYTISSSSYPSDYDFTISGAELTFDYEGTPVGTDQFSITSYKKGSPNTPVAWSIDGYMLQNDDGTWPTEWSSTAPAMLNSHGESSGVGSTTSGETRTVTVNKDSIDQTIDSRRQTELRSRSAKTNLDLSLFKTDNNTAMARTTANCYIVRYPGTYKFPLVVGNTIQGGTRKTPDTYVTIGASGSGTFTNGTTDNKNVTWYYGYNIFRDYLGRIITSSTTYDNLQGAQTPLIVWHDFYDMENKVKMEGVIKNMSITTEGSYKFLNFEVDKDKIQQGNALLAVKDASGRIMWSWHIYVTDLDWTDPITTYNYRGETYKMARENIGYVAHRYNVVYPERKMKIRVRQAESDGTAEVIVTRQRHTNPRLYHRDVKYQWGRKDPFPQPEQGEDVYLTVTEGGTIPVIDTSNRGKLYDFGNTASPLSATQNPTKMYNMNGNDMGCWAEPNQTWLNLWAADNDGLQIGLGTGVTGFLNDKYKTSKKTIYDPSPPGFKVAVGVAFTGIQQKDETGNITGGENISYFNVKGAYAEGWTMYSDGNHSHTAAQRQASETYFLPNTSMISRDGILRKYSTDMAEDEIEGGWIWTAFPKMNAPLTGRYMGKNMSFRHVQMNVAPQNGQCCGLSVRPMTDE